MCQPRLTWPDLPIRNFRPKSASWIAGLGGYSA